MRRALGTAAALTGLLALGACSVGPDYALPTQALVNAPKANTAFAGETGPALKPQAPPDNWWKLYRDDRLDRLVQAAFAANTDLRVAEANLEKSRALVSGADAARQPAVGAKIAVAREQVSGESYLLKDYIPPENLYDSGLTASYDLDLFGRLRRTVEAAKADDEAVEAARDLVKVNVAADTTRAYAEVCNAGAELSVARRALELQRQSLDLTHRLVAAGKAASIDAIRSTALPTRSRPIFRRCRRASAMRSFG